MTENFFRQNLKISKKNFINFDQNFLSINLKNFSKKLKIDLIEHHIKNIDFNLIRIYRGLDTLDQSKEKTGEGLLLSEGEFRSGIFKLI